MKKFFAKTKFIQLIIIVLILLILDGLLSYNSFLNNNSLSGKQITSSIPAEEPIGEIVEGVTVVQEIPFRKDVSNVSVLFATYKRINKGNLFVEIVGKDSGLIYGKQKYDVSTFSDNSFVTIPFDVMASSQDDSTLYRYERNEQRQGYRSGHYNRNLTTTSGDVTLKVPKLKGISFETAIIERYRRRESSVEEALIEMYLAGVSVRRVEDITEALWGSKSLSIPS